MWGSNTQPNLLLFLIMFVADSALTHTHPRVCPVFGAGAALLGKVVNLKQQHLFRFPPHLSSVRDRDTDTRRKGEANAPPD